MKEFGKRYLWLWLILGIYAIGYATTYFPEGDAPLPGDTEKRSLQKINSILNGIANMTNAGIVTWASAEAATVDSTPGDLANKAGLGSGAFYVRKVLIYADSANETNGVNLVPDGDIAPILLQPGDEYLIDVPHGTKFDLNSWTVYAETGTERLTFFYLQ